MPTEVEVIYMIGIKTALSIRDNTNNEIVYIESGLYPIECIVKKRQLSFWMHILKSSESNQLLRSMLQKVSAYDIYYIKYYKKLESTYKTLLMHKRLSKNHMQLSGQTKLQKQ